MIMVSPRDIDPDVDEGDEGLDSEDRFFHLRTCIIPTVMDVEEYVRNLVEVLENYENYSDLIRDARVHLAIAHEYIKQALSLLKEFELQEE